MKGLNGVMEEDETLTIEELLGYRVCKEVEVSHTTKGMECIGKQWRIEYLESLALPLPCSGKNVLLVFDTRCRYWHICQAPKHLNFTVLLHCLALNPSTASRPPTTIDNHHIE